MWTKSFYISRIRIFQVLTVYSLTSKANRRFLNETERKKNDKKAMCNNNANFIHTFLTDYKPQVS